MFLTFANCTRTRPERTRTENGTHRNRGCHRNIRTQNLFLLGAIFRPINCAAMLFLSCNKHRFWSSFAKMLPKTGFGELMGKTYGGGAHGECPLFGRTMSRESPQFWLLITLVFVGLVVVQANYMAHICSRASHLWVSVTYVRDRFLSVEDGSFP